MKQSIMCLQGVSRNFGGLRALNEVSFNIAENSIHGLIGPNGAGKSTLVNIISAIDSPSSGKIIFKGQAIQSRRPSDICKMGIGRTYQITQNFNRISVLENVMVGCQIPYKLSILLAGIGIPSYRVIEQKMADEALRWLNFVGLQERAEQKASELPYGSQRLLELARILAGHGDMIILDEPAAGLNSKETDNLAEIIFKLKSMGKTILLIEHDMNLVMNVCDQISVLNYGEVIACGPPEEISNNEQVINAYLGGRKKYGATG